MESNTHPAKILLLQQGLVPRQYSTSAVKNDAYLVSVSGEQNLRRPLVQCARSTRYTLINIPALWPTGLKTSCAENTLRSRRARLPTTGLYRGR